MDNRSWLIVVLLGGTGFLFYLLAPVLTPFLLAALLAYIGDPLVDRLESGKLSRTLAVSIVFLLLSLLALVMLFILVPLIEKQVSVFVSRLPAYIDWLQQTAMPWLQARFGLEQMPDVAELKQALQAHWQQAGGLAVNVLASISRSGGTLLALLANIVLVPLVTFYMLRDWDVMITRIRELLPRRIEPLVVKLATESDDVLGAFVRGQLLVMLSLSIIYSVGLLLMGLEYALLIGIIAGFVSFVPYLGMIIGVMLAVAAGLFQFQDIFALWPLIVVFGIGQLLESFVLTPLLVGDKIGLHPVAVIFAIAAFGQLFGFFGVLLALPVAAVIVVVIRHVHDSYRKSALYAEKGPGEPDTSQCGDGC
ncbi:AI-2E family transporter [Sulfuriflexus sp.]|uniref:AI-2E family transporter n=1 Tax=Sulfuriflexus sp. TaxID=2015443 RepID=UPI0028CF840D|nr:AI-2E family transporter [Sulfuriflexus sp.]MDT8404643.1 AI-2E family transporter [Sulfuriflexus sp.]